MPPLSVYIGLFTGTILAGLGVYLLLNPLSAPNFSPTLIKTFSYFLIGYGGFRIGYSLYLIRRHRKGTRLPFWIIPFTGLALQYCSSGPEENVRVHFEYAGDCATCPLSRMDSLLRVYFPNGITSLRYDSTAYEVILGIDSHKVRLDTLRAVLVAYGYQVDEDIAVDPILAPCCVLPESETASSPSSGEASLSLGSSADLQSEMSLLERELMDEGILGDESAGVSINLDAELGLEDELGGLEDLDLEGGLDMGEDLGLDDLDMDMDLELDDLGGSPPKKKTPAKK